MAVNTELIGRMEWEEMKETGWGKPEEEQVFTHCIFCCCVTLDDVKNGIWNSGSNAELFCRAFSIDDVSIESSLRRSTLCMNCGELVESITKMLKTIQEIEVKLNMKKETVCNLLRQEQSLLSSGVFPGFSPIQLRADLQRKLYISPLEPELNIKPEDVDITVPLEGEFTVFGDADPLELPNDMLYTAEESARITDSDEERVKYTLPPGTVLRECSVQLERLRGVKWKQGGGQKLSKRRKLITKKSKDPNRPIPCNFIDSDGSKCFRFFPDEEGRVAHVRKVHMIKDLNCGLCGNEYDSKTTFFHHLVMVHGEPYPFLCKETGCGRGFIFADGLKCHMVVHTGGPSIQKQKEEKRKNGLTRVRKGPGKLIPCTYVGSEEAKCHQFFPNKSTMQAHLRVAHMGKSTCRFCDTTFDKKKALVYHELEVHGKPLPFLCPVEHCGKGFMTGSALKYHKLSHTGEYPYRCQKCGNGFACKAKLEEHMPVHLDKNSKNFVCEVCGKTCKSFKLVKLHQRYHFLPRQYKCNLCPWTFKTPGQVSSHMRGFHSENRPHLCPKCGATFKQKRNLNRHLLSESHGKRKFSHRKRTPKSPPSDSVRETSGDNSSAASAAVQ